MSATQNQQEPHFGGVENLLLVKVPLMKYPINPLTLSPTVSCNVPYLSVAINTQIPIPIPHLHSLPKPYTNHLSQMNTIQTKGSRQVLPAKEFPQPTTIPLKKKDQRQLLPSNPNPKPPGDGKGKRELRDDSSRWCIHFKLSHVPLVYPTTIHSFYPMHHPSPFASSAYHYSQ